MILEIFTYLPYIMGALVIFFFLTMFLLNFYQRIVLGKSKDEIKKEEHDNFSKFKNEQNELQKKKVLDMFLKLTDDDYEKVFFELMTITEGESLDRFSLGLLEVLSIYGDAKELRKEARN